MTYISLYRKYRPKKFEEVVGQKVVVQILKNMIINNSITHAYIFSGPRGTGKTSIAKIFSKAINCRNPQNGDLCGECDICLKNGDDIDIVEIDAASNNGVDEIREIRNNAKLLPTNLKYKVYIIDEVHMLSNSAFNALLKTLEEPPSHVIFILATTEFNKIPQTVISRCQKFEFKKINDDDIVGRLKYILEKENKQLDENNLKLIAKISNGGLRDAINLLDQVLSIKTEKISQDDIFNLIGEISQTKVKELFEYIINADISKSINFVDEYTEQGKNYVNLVKKLQDILKDILIYNGTDKYFDSEYEKELSKYSKIDIDKLISLTDYLFELNNELKRGNNQKIVMDIYVIKMSLLFTNNSSNSSNIVNEEKKDYVNIENNTGDEENNIDKLKDIKINNAFFGANKNSKQEFVEKYNNINDYLFVKEYNSIANLMKKAVPEVVSDKNIIFSFKNNFDVVLFNKNIDDIQKFLKKVYNIKYSIVAVDTEEWENIKKIYIQNLKNNVKYKYIEEKSEIKTIKKNTQLQSSLENIFGDSYTTLE